VDHAGHLHRSFPWRTTTLVVGAIAAVELVALLGVAGVRIAPRLHLHHAAKAATAATAAPARHPTKPHRAPAAWKPAAPRLRPARPVSRVSVLVLNGNGVTGAAGAEATRLSSQGYRSASAADAARHDYAATIVMFAPGYEAEGRRLARQLHTRLVSPVEGMTGAQLRGSQLVAILGGS
jgi:LytR cell envelope-related transcriptional attenuator